MALKWYQKAGCNMCYTLARYAMPKDSQTGSFQTLLLLFCAVYPALPAYVRYIK
jgi:hypothetical protein